MSDPKTTTRDLGLGCLGMIGAYGIEDPEQTAATICTALESGIAVIDTADYYGDGANEELIGRTLTGHRDDITISVKTGIRSDAEQGKILDGSPEYLRAACDNSLKRLGTDHLDLYCLAWVDPKVPIEDSVGALGELLEAGKIRGIGLSEVAVGTLRRACAVQPISALLTEYSLWERHVEPAILPAAEELGVRLWAYAPLGRGFLTGAVYGMSHLDEGDWRHNFPRFLDEHVGHNLALLGPLRGVADSHGASMAQVALAWVLSRRSAPLALVGCKTPRHLVENLEATNLALTDRDLALLENSFPAAAISGDRYAPMVAALMDDDT
ncbi:MAG: putative aldo-keto reductase 2 [Amycolatopsis sp.]|uniref:aldo/keto reductase n=1 Tax=Amycolatopsis sp. TaxID=37632 RepID=UPI002604EAA6|nr:aldo/keto reductase [Amycolatopsis sp.]MCU1686710.1 putative aldo-keto reductase 2 [Amycolatopsis sp.]